MMELKALLILNGNIKDLNVLYRLGKESDFILCADGGTDYALKASLMPDMIIGDLDSISKDGLKIVGDSNIPIERFPIKKDATDSELAIEFLIQKGYKNITIMGGLGDRMDHTLGNILLLDKLNKNGVMGKIIEKNNTIYLVEKELRLEKEKDFFVSLIPISNLGAIITLEGFEYRLNKTNLDFGSTRGISNRIIEDQACISVHKGQCLVVISKD